MNENITIMLVEDDDVLKNELRNYLCKWGYTVTEPVDLQDITTEFHKPHPHVVLMDIGLPYFDGYYWCKKIREFSKVPILFISSRNDDRDKIMAITQGGDDYVEKPFNLELLRAKIDAILRRAYEYRIKKTLSLDTNLFFDYGTHDLTFQDRKIELTKSETRILIYLIEHKGEVVTREELMDQLWSTDEFVSDSTLTTLISRLRTKIAHYYKNDFIQTKKGQGYFIK